MPLDVLPELLLLAIFLIGFLLNLVWEFSHSRLYETCRRQSWEENVPLLVTMALKDGLLLVVFYLLSSLAFVSVDITRDPFALVLFVSLGLSFSSVDERLSLRWKRWEYAASMPTVLGVGVTPLLELPVTGVATLVLIFRLFPHV